MIRSLLEKFVVSDSDKKIQGVLKQLKEMKYWGL